MAVSAPRLMKSVSLSGTPAQEPHVNVAAKVQEEIGHGAAHVSRGRSHCNSHHVLLFTEQPIRGQRRKNRCFAAGSVLPKLILLNYRKESAKARSVNC